MHHRQVDRNGDPRHAGEDCCRLQSGHQPNFFSRSWIVVPPHTVPGWSPVALQIAAVIRLAEPMIALACVELGSFKASATACQLMPPTVSGEYIAPQIAYRLATSMNGIVPPGS